MKVVIAGGGTGGHIYPALAIAKALKSTYNAEIIFIGGKKGIEKDILPNTGLQYFLLDVEGFRRKLSFKNIITAYKAFRAIQQSKRIIKEFNPDLVIVTGGYVSGPIGQAANSLKIPLFLQEQNSYPGITIKLLSKRARKIFLGSKGAEKYLPRTKCVFTGNPVRDEIINIQKEEARRKMNIGSKSLLLITGGSQGARAINEAIRLMYDNLAHRDDLIVIHHTGRNDFPKDYKKTTTQYKEIMTILGAEAAAIERNIFVTPFIKDMATVLAASDLVVSRAGAIFLSEAAVVGVPLVLIPYPFAAENHQRYNALIWEEKKAGVLVPEEEIVKLPKVLFDLLDDKNLRLSMAINAKSLGNPKATEVIVRELNQLH